ncbi:uncharacterized protein BXIN_1886 [Babesia sp. Xinjiang]|uniref:uncharacterized protein n=1 Tax=Babesia sp. Xinjiang TaxID=462227 RepID=UPI000A22F3D2|nr:uncharacterized protein BXIN_1886 [Babesia sp. Xinjiang]ORM40340.1 hypothetical protein BXIN_1886 [Babesia sp. Xinjiang]
MIQVGRLWISGFLLLTIRLLSSGSKWRLPLAATLSAPAPQRRPALGLINISNGTRWRNKLVEPAACFVGRYGAPGPCKTIFRAKRHSEFAATGDDGVSGIANIGLFRRVWETVKRFFGAGERADASQLLQVRDRITVPGSRPFSPMTINMAMSDTGAGALAESSPYAQLVQSQPSAVMTHFVDQAPLRVREAVKSTVSSLVGSLYRHCVETTIITTAERLAALIHSMQMTGYMLWNAECRYCLSQQLEQDTPPPPANVTANAERSGAGLELKDQITPPCNKDSLLWYIKNMPDETANALLDNITTDVMEAMQKSADLVVESLTGMALAQRPPISTPMNNGAYPPRVIVQQTGSSCVQLCFWQLALGYCLRQQEAKLELQNALKDS